MWSRYFVPVNLMKILSSPPFKLMGHLCSSICIGFLRTSRISSMAFPNTVNSNAELKELSTLDTDRFQSIHVSDTKPQLNSCARLPAFIGLAVVREAWAATISRILNATRPLTFNIEYLDDSITLIQVKLAAGSSLITPPPSPGTTTLAGPLLQQTTIIYINSLGDERPSIHKQPRPSSLFKNVVS
jgi:hypothetical protein